VEITNFCVFLRTGAGVDTTVDVVDDDAAAAAAAADDDDEDEDSVLAT
jgi:hypothetical protein